MRNWILAVVLVFGFVGTAAAQEDAIQGVIGNQIEAFKADDFAGAFEFASPNIRGMFQSPENFGRMVMHGYPMVWRPAEVGFLELREINGNLWQKVQIVDGEGRVYVLDYGMLQTADGWKINGVRILEASQLSA